VNPRVVEERVHDDSIQRGLDYAELVTRVREMIESFVPPGATVAIVSKGDSELLRLGNCVAWHFPRTASGAYAGHHPAGDEDAIARFETTRADGASFLVFPATAFWWLDHYVGFKNYIDSRYARIAERPDTAIIYSLSGIVAPGADPNDARHDPIVGQVRALANSLLPAGAKVIVATQGDERLLELGGPVGSHFPQRQDGYYAGADPTDSSSAVAHLELLRMAGAEYLLIPSNAYWWLERYAGFRAYLNQAYSLVTRQENVCTIYDLRETFAYEELVDSVREAATTAIPPGAITIVATNGESRLLDLSNRKAWHFPQAAADPANDAHAIALVEDLRTQGAGYFVMPRTVFSWLAQYADMTRYLDTNYQRIISNQRCIVYDLAVHHVKAARRGGPRRSLNRRKNA
jgi:hypothetical protein